MHEIKSFLTGEELSKKEIDQLLELAEQLKLERRRGIIRTQLAGKTLAMLFDKQSFRTKLSFTIAMQELGGSVVESLAQDRKKEDPEDLARVLNGYCHGVVLRTHEQSNLERMATVSRFPILNGLSDTHHPCQILADILTLKQNFGSLPGLKLSYIGDGNNILHSLMLLAPQMGIHLRYSCPDGYLPNTDILEKALSKVDETAGSITRFARPLEAAQDANALYTDVWTSMGFEKEKAAREAIFQDYQLNARLFSQTAPGAVVMHCLPMEKEKEITSEMANHPASVIFQQSENRLHVQKALLCTLLVNEDSTH
ncbi:MAG: ornithine carbamoyltransferase [Bdellovibrionia bacterium]